MTTKRRSIPVVTTAPTRTVAYVRVSTAQQATEGESLEAQQEKLRLYAQLQGLELVAIEVDAGVSASSLERPGLARALARLDRFEASALLVVKLDRLTRSVRDLCTLVETYFSDGTVSLMSVGENVDTRTASGRLVLNILTTVSQWEREAAAERTAAVMSFMKAAGKFTGGFPPIGFYVDADGELEEHAEEQYIIRTAKAMRAEGTSLRDIAMRLPNNPRTGKVFDAKQIQRMVQS